MKEALKKFPKTSFAKPSGIKNVSIDAITGRQITSATKQKSYDIFPSWYKVPLANGQAAEVKVDKLSGKLATDKCPAELIETRIYSPIQAEIPANDASFSRWNPPVLAWAKAKGYTTDAGSIPTEKCDIHTGEDLPTIEFESPTEGQIINSPFTIVLSVATPKGFKSLIVTVDGKTYTPVLDGSFYKVEVLFTTLGSKKITATVKDSAFQTATTSVVVNVE
jgi:hypothetical protein